MSCPDALDLNESPLVSCGDAVMKTRSLSLCVGPNSLSGLNDPRFGFAFVSPRQLREPFAGIGQPQELPFGFDLIYCVQVEAGEAED